MSGATGRQTRLARAAIADNVISNDVKPRPVGRGAEGPMGTKITVVGGGSTYTPELVEGFVNRARPAAHRRARPARHGRGPARDRRRSRPAHARSPRLGGAPPTDRRPRRRARWRGLRPVPAARRRPGRAPRSTRRVPLQFGVIGQETTGAGGFAKALRTVPVVLELAELAAKRAAPERLDRRLHESGGHRDPGADRRRPPRDRAVQRRHQHATPVRRGVRGGTRAGRARACRAQSPELGAGDPRRRRRSPARAARAKPRSWPSSSGCPRT